MNKTTVYNAVSVLWTVVFYEIQRHSIACNPLRESQAFNPSISLRRMPSVKSMGKILYLVAYIMGIHAYCGGHRLEEK